MYPDWSQLDTKFWVTELWVERRSRRRKLSCCRFRGYVQQGQLLCYYFMCTCAVLVKLGPHARCSRSSCRSTYVRSSSIAVSWWLVALRFAVVLPFIESELDAIERHIKRWEGLPPWGSEERPTVPGDQIDFVFYWSKGLTSASTALMSRVKQCMSVCYI